MPFITIESGTLTAPAKRRTYSKINGSFFRNHACATRFFVTTIKEVSDKNFGIGGKTIDKVKDEYRKAHSYSLGD